MYVELPPLAARHFTPCIRTAQEDSYRNNIVRNLGDLMDFISVQEILKGNMLETTLPPLTHDLLCECEVIK